MECKKCNGTLSYVVFDHHVDAPLNVDCWDCLSVLNEKDSVTEDFARLLAKASPQKLAQILATFLVNKYHVEREGDLSSVVEITKSKDLMNALALCSAYAE